jgi:hypothetical protein
MKRISKTKASRAAAEREEFYRINVLLDQALELTFPCSDPVAISINGIYAVFRSKRPPIPKKSVAASRDPKD